MKKIFALAALVSAAPFCGALVADDGSYALNNGGNGKSYIDITEKMDEFSFSVGGYSSGTLAGKIGYFTFEGKPKKDVVAAAAQGGTLIGADQTTVTLKDVEAGTHIGFYLADAHGNLNTAFQFTGDPAIGDLAIEFKGNGHNPNGNGNGHSSHGNGWGIGHMEGGWMKIGSLGGSSVPTGRPLPGVLASLFAGALAVGAAAVKKRKRTAKSAEDTV